MPRKVDIPKLLGEAAELSKRAASLAIDGRIADAFSLEQEADGLRHLARRAAARSLSATNRDSGTGDGTGAARNDRSESTRAVAVASLGEMGVPVSPRVLAEYARARFGTRMDHRALASIRRDEWRAWSAPRSFRPVYIVPALEGLRFLPARGKVARSDWPLERRILGPWSERADHLNATINLARHLAWLSKADPEAGCRLADLLEAFAATIPGAGNADEKDSGRIEEAARAELAVIGPQDVRWRHEAAERASRILNEQQVLWGAPPPRAADEPA